jgi:cytochrome c-type biogenesis protein CcmH/NrfF
VIAADLQNGMSTSEIFDDLAASYGDEIILTPTSSGVTGLVWILPVVFGVFAVAALVVVFRRWSRTGALEASDEDRALVDEARHQEPVVP